MRFSARPQTLLLNPYQQDDTPWLGHAPDGTTQGARAVGPAGFVDRLELLVGLPSGSTSPTERLLRWHRTVGALDDGARSYSASRRADPWGVSRHLLARRDAARDAGWDQERLTGTRLLEDLQAIEDAANVSPTLKERARALGKHLNRCPALRVVVALPEPTVPPWMVALLAALVEAGSSVEFATSGPVDDGTDLGRLQRALIDHRPFTPTGDGSVVFVEGDTPWTAGEHLMACASADVDSAWVVTREPELLDRVRHRNGRPQFGLTKESLAGWRDAVWLRLLLELDPTDVQRAYALVTLPGGPLAPYARKLSRALRDVPATWSEVWERAVEEVASLAGREAYDAASTPEEGVQLARIATQQARAAVRDWIPDGASPPDVVGCLDRLAREAPDGLAVVVRVIRDLATSDATAPSASGIGEWFDVVPVATRRLPGEAGHPAWCRDPAAVATAKNVIWWGFTESGAPDTRQLWSSPERAALQRSGIDLPPAGEHRRREREAWVRPLIAATEQVTLVRWRTEGGTETAPHPLQDELDALLGEAGVQSCTADPAHHRTQQVPIRASAPPRGVWTVELPDIGPPRTLSPTSIETLLGCPLRWTLRYLADLRGGGADGPMTGAPLAGTLAHLVLQDVLLGRHAVDVRSADAWTIEQAADSSFDEHLHTVAPGLAASGSAKERERLQRITTRAAVELVHQLQAGGWWPLSVEEQLVGRFAGEEVRGYADLVVTNGSGDLAVIDIKLGRFAGRREQLQNGQAVQLAVYAAGLRRSRSDWPATGYLIVQEGRLLATDRAFPDALEVETSMEDTFLAAETAYRYWIGQVQNGSIDARADDIYVPPAELPDHPVASIEPPCRYCDFRVLCSPREDG